MRNTIILTAALLATACETPEGQATGQAANNEVASQSGDMTAPGQNDGAMAAQVSTGSYIAQAANSDLYEIRAGELATKNGMSEQVKDFGTMMVADHTRSSQEMKALVDHGDFATPMPTRLDTEHQAMLDRLKAARGEAFDREYMAQQMTAHSKALALHQNFAQNGEDAGLKAFAAKVVPVVQKHHDMLNRDGAATRGGTSIGATNKSSGSSPEIGAGQTTGTAQTSAGSTGGSASVNRQPRATGTPSDQ
jgi:putative membrane protein